MKVVFLGLNEIGDKVLEYLKSLNQDELYLITKKEELKKVKEIQPNIILSVGFRHIVPKDILSVPPLGAINFHKSLLPLSRGANPVIWTIIENAKAGVTIHYMDEGIDTGDIIAQREVNVSFSDNAKDLYQKLEKVQMSLFKEVWPAIRKGDARGISQCGQPSYHVMNDFKKARSINPEQKMRIIDFVNYLRAMTFPPFCNAYIEKNGKKYFIEINIKEEQTLICNEDKPFLKQYGFENG